MKERRSCWNVNSAFCRLLIVLPILNALEKFTLLVESPSSFVYNKFLSLFNFSYGYTCHNSLLGPRYDIKLHLIVRLQFWSFMKCGVTPSLPLLHIDLWHAS